jgi:hypothetical protein
MNPSSIILLTHRGAQAGILLNETSFLLTSVQYSFQPFFETLLWLPPLEVKPLLR